MAGNAMNEIVRNKRYIERAEIALGASCRTDTCIRAFVAMIDLTVTGCRLFGRESSFTVGQKVTLHPECLAPMKGAVQWSRGPLAGILFDNELYPAVFEHLARTHPWSLSEPAKHALSSEFGVSSSVQFELVKVLERAETRFRERNILQDVLTTRPNFFGSRPGLAPQRVDPKRVKLFLG